MVIKGKEISGLLSLRSDPSASVKYVADCIAHANMVLAWANRAVRQQFITIYKKAHLDDTVS